MIRTLTIVNDAKSSVFKKIIYAIKPNVPKYRVISYNNIDIMQIICNYRNKKIPWKKILNLIQDENRSILCREDISIPNNIGIKRYSSNLFTKQLCKNASVEYIKVNHFDPRGLKVVLFDKDAKYIDILENIIMLTSDIKVVTDSSSVYFNKADRLMDEYGASIVIADSKNFSSCADILIAPDKITHRLDLKKNAVIFTSQKPSVPLDGTIYYSYKIKLPQKFKNIVPDDLEPVYFLSALYDQYNMKKLSTIVPSHCVSDNKIIPI